MADSPFVCPACASTSVGTTFETHDRMFGLPGVHTYHSCGDCGSLVWRSSDPAGTPSYPDAYYSIADDPSAVMASRVTRFAVRRVVRSVVLGRQVVARSATAVLRERRVATLVRMTTPLGGGRVSWSGGTRVLDVGSGSGLLVHVLAFSTGARVVGVDPYTEDRQFPSGGRVIRGGIEAAPAGGYDVVMLHHSLEHVAEPVTLLSQCLGVLAPGGVIVVRMPTATSYAWDEYGIDWAQLDAPRHLCVMSRDGAARAFDRAGLRVVEGWDDSSGFQFWGSEQIRRGMNLMDPGSLMASSSSTLFTRRQLQAWETRARELNAAGAGDQAVWILRPSSAGAAIP